MLRRRGYRLLLETLSPTRGKNPYTDLVESRRIDGLLMLSPREDDAALIELIESDYPIVLLGSIGHPKEVSVDTPSTVGLRAAVDHVVNLGHRAVGSVPFSPSGFAAADHRLAELRTFLADHSIPLDEDAVVRGDFSAGERLPGRNRTDEVPARRHGDLRRQRHDRARRHRGARAPRALRSQRRLGHGFDDLPFAGYVAPPLTTVRIDATHQGRCAAEVLLLRLKGKPVPEPRQTFVSVFVPRGSSARAARTGSP